MSFLQNSDGSINKPVAIGIGGIALVGVWMLANRSASSSTSTQSGQSSSLTDALSQLQDLLSQSQTGQISGGSDGGNTPIAPNPGSGSGNPPNLGMHNPISSPGGGVTNLLPGNAGNYAGPYVPVAPASAPSKVTLPVHNMATTPSVHTGSTTSIPTVNLTANGTSSKGGSITFLSANSTGRAPSAAVSPTVPLSASRTGRAPSLPTSPIPLVSSTQGRAPSYAARSYTQRTPTTHPTVTHVNAPLLTANTQGRAPSYTPTAARTNAGSKPV